MFMSECGYKIATELIPEKFPTHAHSAEFCEAVGRAVMTCGYLENCLLQTCRALLMLNEKESGRSAEEVAKEADLKIAAHASDTLFSLIKFYGECCNNNRYVSPIRTEKVAELCKKIGPLRNVLCHGFWHKPGVDGSVKIDFVNRKLEKFDTPITIEWLNQMQRHCAEVAAEVESTWALALGNKKYGEQ